MNSTLETALLYASQWYDSYLDHLSWLGIVASGIALVLVGGLWVVCRRLTSANRRLARENVRLWRELIAIRDEVHSWKHPRIPPKRFLSYLEGDETQVVRPSAFTKR